MKLNLSKKKIIIISVVGVVVIAVAVGLGVGLSDNSKGSGEEATTSTPATTTTTEAPATTTTTEAPATSLPLTRLPTALEPQHYDVTLQPFISGDFSFNGSVAIHILVKEPTNQIILHMADITADNDTVKLVRVEDFTSTDGTEVAITKHDYNSEFQFYIGDAEVQLMPEEKFIFSLNYTGTLNDQMRGFYRSSYENSGNETVYLAMTQMSPNDARMAFPCFDEPALKATFNITIIREENFAATANTPLLSSDALTDQPGWIKDVFEQTPKMSTYLVAFVVSDFVSNSTSIDGGRILFSVMTRPEAIEQAAYAAEVAPLVLKFFEEFFGIQYPLKKLDMVAVPDFAAGAMENWGLITYRETAMLYDPLLSTASNKQRVGVVVAHELAHQWFGNLVTPAWWSDIWLNEGFASYMEYVGLDAHEPEWGMLNMFVYEDLQSVMVPDSQLTSHPVSMEANTTAQITALFDTISYSKGACLVRMLRNSLGDSTFRNGLTNYLNMYAMSAATQDNLWSALSTQAVTDGVLPAGLTVKEIMDTWTLQMGYPYVSVTMDANGSAIVTQKRFLAGGSADSSDAPDYMWWIPLTYTKQLGIEPTHGITWINQSQSTMVIDDVASSGEWVIFNTYQYGYYRVNYDSSNWQSLTEQLFNDYTAIHETNRAQLMDDILNLARAGIVPYETALNLTSYLFKERSYVPWASAVRCLKYLENMFTGTDGYSYLVDFLLRMISPLYEEIISEGNAAVASHQQQLLQATVLIEACRMEYAGCITFATKSFNEWKLADGSETSVPPNFKSAVYCTGVAQGGTEDWDFVWSRYLASDLATERVLLLQALACSKDETTLQNYLEMAFDESSGIKKQDAPTVFAAIAANDVGRNLSWHFLFTNWDSIAASSDAFTTLSSLIDAATAEFSTQQELNELEAFQELHSSTLGTAEQSVQQAIERTETNIAWIENYYDSIVTWLNTEEALTIRLPRSLTPLHYDITLQPILEGNFSIFGQVTILMRVDEPTSRIVLHAADINVTADSIQVTKDSSSGEAVPYIRHEYNTEFEYFVIHLHSALAADETVVLSMSFTGLLNDQLKGFYRSVYQNELGEDVYIATTQFQPTDARRAFPCFDEPAMKANFSISIIREEGKIAISNMPVVSSTALDDQPGWVLDKFDESVPMSTYLVAFVVSDFANLTNQTTSGIEFRVFARNEGVNMAQFALDTGVDVLTFFEGYFGIPYPLPKQDMFAIPDFAAGAMENWGLITYRESAFLYDESISTTSNLQRVGIIVSHELAHQWFGNLVTPSWWTDLWLNEGFASYMEYIGLNHAHPTWNMMDQFVSIDLHYVMGIDALSSSHPIRIVVENPAEISEIFDVISYSKGASIIRMMSSFLTEETFTAGITNYLTGRAYEAAEQNQLWEYLTAEAHTSGTLPNDTTVQAIMDTWTLQIGFPVITVNRSDNGTTATVTQAHFLLSGETSSNTWWVPLTYFVEPGSGTDVVNETIWLEGKEMEVTDLPSAENWVIFNFQQTGYYRVNYDANNWNSIIRQLISNHTVIGAINRAQILDDTANLARAGLLSYQTAYDAHSYLVHETEYVPWYSAIRNLMYIESMFSSTTNHSTMQMALQGLIQTRFAELGFTETTQDSHLTLLQRTLIVSWACQLEHPECLSSASTLFQSWLANNGSETAVVANLKSTVYCVGIAEGDNAVWDFAFEVALRTNLASERDLLLSALGCSKNETILSNYLDMAFTESSGVRKQDSSRVFAAVASNDLGRTLAWNYLKDNFEDIMAYSSSFLNAGGYIEAATQEMNTQTELEELLAFRETYFAMLGSAARTTGQAVERVTANIAWMEKNFETLLELVSPTV